MAQTQQPEPAQPTPQVVPPQPNAAAVLQILKQAHRNWVAAGGASIYGTPIAMPPSLPPANTVTGTAAVGQVLTCTTGTWSGAPTTYAYQWRRDTLPIGTNANTYTTVAGDSTHAVGCVVTATNMWGQASAPLSNTRAIP
jgi:hypothetical protein